MITVTKEKKKYVHSRSNRTEFFDNFVQMSAATKLIADAAWRSCKMPHLFEEMYTCSDD